MRVSHIRVLHAPSVDTLYESADRMGFFFSLLLLLLFDRLPTRAAVKNMLKKKPCAPASIGGIRNIIITVNARTHGFLEEHTRVYILLLLYDSYVYIISS